MESQAYFWFKAFHIIGVVVWFSGLFYLVRLFIYHVEADEQPEPARQILKSQYATMEKRLYGIITLPGMIVTIAMAIGLLSTVPDYMHEGWLNIKMAFVFGLVAYHFYCAELMKQLAAGTCTWGSKQLRALNEAPTLLLITIVLLAVFKNDLPLNTTGAIILGLIAVFAATIQLYAKKRRQDKEKQLAQTTQE
jgi:protoporphyrinogen IX oxidase